MKRSSRFKAINLGAFIGIWWFWMQDVIAIKELVKTVVPSAPGVVDSDLAHFEHWPMIRRQIGVQGEYFSIPRGRVLYRCRDSRFIVLCGREVARNPHAIRAIASEFCLAENAFLVEQDLHYCLLSDEELNVEFE